MFPNIRNHVHVVIRTSICLLLVHFFGEKKNTTKLNIIGSQEGLLLSKLICSDAVFSCMCDMHLPTTLASN